MNHTVTVLMYHGVADAQGQCPGADPHYAVSARQFAAHLALARDAGLRVASVADLLRSPDAAATSVAFTFDDGHGSNGPAAELIARDGGSADFFVNPSQVGTPHYLGWSDLRRMADAGMSIQSHGFHHRYLDDLTPQDVMSELVDSKKAIEDNLGRPVTLFAPPGGRIVADMQAVAAAAGYEKVCSSRVDLWSTAGAAWDVPRLAVLDGTSDEQLARWLHQDWWEITRLRARHGVLSSAKRLLGNGGYERLRGRLLRSGS